MAKPVRRRAAGGQAPRSNGSQPRRPSHAGASHKQPGARRAQGLGSTYVKDRGRLSGRLNPKVRMRLFLQSSALDFALVLVVSTCLALTLSFGFESAWEYRGNPLVSGGLAVPLLLAMYAGSWSKKALAPGVAAVVVIAVAEVGIAMAISPEPLMADGNIQDTSGNYTIFAIVCVASTVLVFLLSRRTTGLVFLLLAVMLSCGAIQFLYPEWTSEEPGLAVTIIATICLGMLVIYQCYRQSIYSANLVKRTSFLGVMGFSALVACFCVVVGAGVFFGAVSAIDYETPDIRPFTQTKSPPLSDEARDYEKKDDESDETTDDTNEEQEQTNQQDGGQGESEDADGNGVPDALEGNLLADLAMAISGMDTMEDEQDYQNISYLIVQITAVIAAVLAALAVIAVVLLMMGRRAWRLRRIANRPKSYQVWYIYTFLLGRFGRLKMKKRASLTPLEFAVGASTAMEPFERDTEGASFVEVSAVYQDAVYGGVEPSDEEMERIRLYYRRFFRNARRHVGIAKWVLWKFWRV